MRNMRPVTRLTKFSSNKLANHEHAIALYFMQYNSCKIHFALKVAPAMAAASPGRSGSSKTSLL